MGATTIFVWDPVFDCASHELDGTGAVKASYTNEPQQYGGVISQHRDGTTSTLHADALGSTRFLTDETGTITDTYLYDAWGNTVAETGTTTLPFKWVGRYGYYTDESTGQVYVRARMYESTVARWCSEDPLRERYSSSNYVYAHNDLSLIDSSGLLTWRTAPFSGIPDWASNSGFRTSDDGLYAMKGDCGAFAWRIEWNPWERTDHLLDPPRRGYIVQKVCIKDATEPCEFANPIANGFPMPVRERNGTPYTTCPNSCYFEIWRVYDGKIYSRPIDGRPKNGSRKDNGDLFARLGHSNSLTNGCTRGSYEQTGYSWFIWDQAMWRRLLNKFHRGAQGINAAGNLYSACATPELETDLLRAYEFIPEKGAQPDPQLPLGTKRQVRATWDCCCDPPSTGMPCNSANPLNEIEFIPYPNSSGST